jgi:hypothetical protein
MTMSKHAVPSFETLPVKFDSGWINYYWIFRICRQGTKHNDLQHNDTGHKGIICDIQDNDTLHNNTLKVIKRNLAFYLPNILAYW